MIQILMPTLLWLATAAIPLAAWAGPSAAIDSPRAPSPAAGAHCYATRNGATACNVDPAIDSTALCNDGTLPAFWVRPGYGAGLSTWVLWLQGGDECSDSSSCSHRALFQPGLVSSKRFGPGTGEGVISSDPKENPALANANVVVMGYCSSDTWVGARSKSSSGRFTGSNTATWWFEGRAIAVADLRSVLELYPALRAAGTIIVGGSSSGGSGATEIVNSLLPYLPALPAGHLLLVNDAGFGLDVGQYEANGQPPSYAYPAHPNLYESTISDRLAFWNGSGDPACLAAEPGATVACYDTGHVLTGGYIALPSFIAESLLDTAQLTGQACPPVVFRPCSLKFVPGTTLGAYESFFSGSMAAELVGNGTRASFTAFAPDVPEHQILADDQVFVTPATFGAVTASARDAFNAWLANPLAPRVVMLGTGGPVPIAPSSVR